MRLRLLHIVTAAAVALFAVAAQAQGSSVELAVKATYLYKFAPYVEWPVGVLGGAQGAFVLCVVGDDPFDSLLDEAVSGQRVNGIPIAVRRTPVFSRDAGCDILFAGGSAQQSVAQTLAEARGQPVLTVTDDENNGGARGIVNFVVVDQRVRFEIDAAAAAQNGLVISSKLLSLAVRPAAQ